MGSGRQGWEKNSLGRKLMLYVGRLENRGWEMGESTPCPPPLIRYNLNSFLIKNQVKTVFFFTRMI